jgi:hypothetical protein
MALEVLRGGRVDPNSGGPGYRGVQQASDPDPFYYRPDVDPPRHPSLLDAAQQPFTSPGLHAPWYATVGNHDVLLAGETPPTPESDAVATGRRLVTSLERRTALPSHVNRAALVRTLVSLASTGRSITVPADPERRALKPEELVRALARGRPTAFADRLDYTVDLGARVRAIVLDTIDRRGGDVPVTDPALLAWLRAQLAAAGTRAVVVFSHQPLPEAALRILDAAPQVVASIAGDTHRNSVAPRAGYWRITTSSLADYPMQSRMFRLREAGPGELVLETWMVDQDGTGLAGVARELAYLDAQGGRPSGFIGSRLDRNVRLFVRS